MERENRVFDVCNNETNSIGLARYFLEYIYILYLINERLVTTTPLGYQFPPNQLSRLSTKYGASSSSTR